MPSPSAGALPHPGPEPTAPASPAPARGFFTASVTREAPIYPADKMMFTVSSFKTEGEGFLGGSVLKRLPEHAGDGFYP